MLNYRRLQKYFSSTQEIFVTRRKSGEIVCYTWKGSTLNAYDLTRSDLRLTFPQLLGRIRSKLR